MQMRALRLALTVLTALTALVLGWGTIAPVQAQAQALDDGDLALSAQIVANCTPQDGCQFLVQFKEPVRVDIIRWDFGDGSPIVAVSPEQPAVHFYTRPGKYVVQATIYFPDRAPITIFEGFHIQPLGDPWQQALKSAQAVGMQIAAALVGLFVVLRALGIVA